jgi:hypothetical protein
MPVLVHTNNGRMMAIHSFSQYLSHWVLRLVQHWLFSGKTNIELAGTPDFDTMRYRFFMSAHV